MVLESPWCCICSGTHLCSQWPPSWHLNYATIPVSAPSQARHKPVPCAAPWKARMLDACSILFFPSWGSRWELRRFILIVLCCIEHGEGLGQADATNFPTRFDEAFISSGIPIMHMPGCLILSYRSWLFYFFFSHYFSFLSFYWAISTDLPLNLVILSLAVLSLLMIPLKSFFISVLVFFISSISILFLIVSISLLKLSIWSYILSTFSTRAFNILVIIISYFEFHVVNFQHLYLITLFLQTVFFFSWSLYAS